jgi:small subunit ribosomal protein S17
MAAKREIEGVVTSDKMQKSIVVAVDRKIRHPLYGKIQRRTTTFMAHDEAGDAKVGDRVQIVEGRPLSRRKRWVLTRVIERAR